MTEICTDYIFFTFSCLIFVLNLYSKIAQKGKKLLEVAISAKVAQKLANTIWRCPVGTKGSVNEKSHFTTVSLIAELHAHEAGEAEHYG